MSGEETPPTSNYNARCRNVAALIVRVIGGDYTAARLAAGIRSRSSSNGRNGTHAAGRRGHHWRWDCGFGHGLSVARTVSGQADRDPRKGTRGRSAPDRPQLGRAPFGDLLQTGI